jgi:hypothetical protein
MKKFISAIFLYFLLCQAMAQDQRTTDLNHRLSNDPVAQSLVRPYVEQLLSRQVQIESAVRELIMNESIRNTGEALTFINLASVVRTADLLQQYDQDYDAFFATIAAQLATQFQEKRLCMGLTDPDLYREWVLDYLEFEVFRPQTDVASTFFAKSLQFESVRTIQNEQENRWLAMAGEDLPDDQPGTDLPVDEEFYWPVLNSSFDLELSDPELELQQFAATQRGGKKFKDILLFIFDNWTTIKDILNWLTSNVFYDCHPSASARIRLTREDVPSSLSPSLRREFRYAVSQNGVMMDGKSTRTRIKGKLKLYKRRPNSWAKDRISLAGINYCSLQWNACEEIPWPANGVPFNQAPNNLPFKAKLNQQHPYSLTIRDVNHEFLTFKLFFNQQVLKTLFLLGSGVCD